MAVAFAPGDGERSAGQLDLGGAGELAEPDAGDQRRAGGGAAGQRRAGAAFPDAQARMAGIADLGEADIGALGEERVVLDKRPDLVELDRGGVVDEEDGVRIL